MMELTKERLQQIVHAAGLEPCDHEEVFDSITVGEIVMMARQLLAGMEQEPVAYMVGDYSLLHHQDPKVDEYLGRATPLYAAPQLPQPAVANEVLKRIEHEANHVTAWHHIDEHSCKVNRRDLLTLVNACRAAMLQGANSPVIPDAWIPVSERMPPNKPGSYEYIVFESLNNRAHHDYWNVPDGSCDDFPPFWNHYGKYVTHWMLLPAAPQQEVK